MPRDLSNPERGWVWPVTMALLAGCAPSAGEVAEVAESRGDLSLVINCGAGPKVVAEVVDARAFRVVYIGGSHRLQLGSRSDLHLQTPVGISEAIISYQDLLSSQEPIEVRIGNSTMTLLISQVSPPPNEQIWIGAHCNDTPPPVLPILSAIPPLALDPAKSTT